MIRRFYPPPLRFGATGWRQDRFEDKGVEVHGVLVFFRPA